MMEPPTIPDMDDPYYEEWLAGKRAVERSYIMTGKPPVLKATVVNSLSEFTKLYSSQLWSAYYEESGDLTD
jgi:hypothetical protein